MSRETYGFIYSFSIERNMDCAYNTYYCATGDRFTRGHVNLMMSFILRRYGVVPSCQINDVSKANVEYVFTWDVMKKPIHSNNYDFEADFVAFCCSHPSADQFAIKKVIFNAPATIVLWEDGTKTVVKCDREIYDYEKGLAMCFAKKALGNKGNYYEVFKDQIYFNENLQTTSKHFVDYVYYVLRSSDACQRN